MKKLLIAVAAAAIAVGAPVAAMAQAPAAAAVAKAGKTLYASTGQRLGSIYRVTSSGDAQVILDGHLVTIPGSTLSDVDGKLTTSLARKDIH